MRISAFYSGFASARLRHALAFWTILLVAVPSAGCSSLSFLLPALSPGDRDSSRSTTELPTGAVSGRGGPGAPPLQSAEDALGTTDWSIAHATLVMALASPEGSSLPWINPQSGTMGMIATVPDLARSCRGFDLTVYRGTGSERLSGEACRTKDAWQVLGLRPTGEQP